MYKGIRKSTKPSQHTPYVNFNNKNKKESLPLLQLPYREFNERLLRFGSHDHFKKATIRMLIIKLR